MEVEKDAPSNQLDCSATAAAAVANSDNGNNDADSCDAICMQAISAASSMVSLFTTFFS